MVHFTKMEGLGNDYIYINNLVEQIPEERLSALALAVSDRHFGVGADGLIVILPPTQPGCDFRFRMFNADGSEGEMCGNGMRCFARYCYDRGLTQKRKFAVQTRAGTIVPEILLNPAGQSVAGVRVDMGEPRLRPAEIPVLGPVGDQALNVPLVVGDRTLRIACVSMGNPHAMVYVSNVDQVDLANLGPAIEQHPAFPERVNVHFVEMMGRHELRMRTWERGSGITLACGTGACAALVATHLLGGAERTALIHLPGGDLEIEWDETTNHVYQTGPATLVCDGTFAKPY